MWSCSLNILALFRTACSFRINYSLIIPLFIARRQPRRKKNSGHQNLFSSFVTPALGMKWAWDHVLTHSVQSSFNATGSWRIFIGRTFITYFLALPLNNLQLNRCRDVLTSNSCESLQFAPWPRETSVPVTGLMCYPFCQHLARNSPAYLQLCLYHRAGT